MAFIYLNILLPKFEIPFTKEFNAKIELKQIYLFISILIPLSMLSLITKSSNLINNKLRFLCLDIKILSKYLSNENAV